MADIIVKKVRTTQPQQPVAVDWSNPITRGLVVAALPTPKGYFNAANGQLIPCPTATNRFNGGGTAKSHVGGNGTTFANTGIPLTTEHTWLTLGVFASSNNATGSVTVSTSTVSVDNWYSVKNSTLWQGDYINSLGAVPLGTPVAVVGTQDGALTVTGYVKGKLSGTHSSGIAAQGNWVIGGYSHATVYTPWVGGCSLAIIFNRVLSSSEIKSLSDNPWQIFAPEKRVITFDSVIAGGGAVDLIGANLVQTDSISSGTITQNHVLTGTHLTQSDSVNSGSITQAHVLTGQNLTQDSSVSNGIVSQIHALNGQGLSQADTITNGVISTSITLSASNLSQTDTVSNGVITQAINISGYNLAQSDNVSISVSFSQTHKLTAQNVTQNDVIGSGSISIGVLKSGRDFLSSVFYVPSPTPNNTGDLARYLTNELQMIQTAIMQLAAGHIDVTNVAPSKPREGDIRLADGVNWNPVGLGKRFVGYRGSTWVDLG